MSAAIDWTRGVLCRHEPWARVWSTEPFDHSTLSNNRERLLQRDVAKKFLVEIVERARDAQLMSDDPFTVDGALIGEPRADETRSHANSSFTRTRTTRGGLTAQSECDVLRLHLYLRLHPDVDCNPMDRVLRVLDPDVMRAS